MVEHKLWTRLIDVAYGQFGFNKEDKWSLFHSLAFDISIWEMCGALFNGSQLVIVPHEISRSAHDFYEWVCTKGITVLNQIPSTFKLFMHAKSNSSRSDRLRFVFFRGEELDQMIVNKWYEQNADSQTVLMNMYGTTETPSAIYKRVEPSKGIHPIGRPFSDLCVYLLDSHGEPVPLGAEGELYISGAGVARGYLNQPELTAKRFLPDTFCENPGARMYRTGDRARYLPNGDLVYLGRFDQQIKIRGYRIEPGEIEAHLVKHFLVKEAVVLTWQKQPDTDAQLVAYVVAEPDSSLAHNLRSYLASLLSDYMVPAAYVCLTSLPLMPNGKLDRRALPAPDGESFVRQSYEAPQTEVEIKLAEIWSDLLGIERISRHDNFFALGGHSLLIVRMLSHLRQAGLDTSVRELFDSRNLTVLPETIGCHKKISIPPNLITKDGAKITPEILPLINLTQTEIDMLISQVPGGISNVQDIYGLAPLQQGILFHHMMAEQGDPYLSVKHLKFKDRATLELYSSALQKLIERHNIMRTAFFWEGLSEPAQVVLRKVPSLLTEVTFDDTDKPILEQLSNQFNSRHYRLELSQAPLIRLLVALTPEGNWVALLLMHHLISDHTTLERLSVEIHTIVVEIHTIDGQYNQLPISIPFRNVVAQARLGISSDSHKKFFSEMLADIDTPTFPFGLSDIHGDGTDIQEAYLMLPNELNNRLRALARRFHVSLASLCHLAWAQVLTHASASEKVVFGTVLLGRLQTGDGDESIMGLLINTLPLRLDINDTAIETAVHNTHARLSALLSHEHASLALAQRCSGISGSMPLFSALLNYRHNPPTKQTITSIDGVTFLDSEARTNYPLILSVDDNDNSLSLSAQAMSSVSAERICAYMQQALVSLADALTHTPQKSVRELTVVPKAERDMLLYDWNQTTVNFPPTRCLHQLFEAQVERDGQATAVECEGETLTYAELNAQANRLAHYLIAEGVKPEDRVALCIKRSTKLLVAFLGILKAGGAYVPLDPVHSSQRLTNILQDADPILLLTDATGMRALGVQKIPVLDLNKPLPANLSQNNPNPIKLGLTSKHLAYMIYTSGSTGTPKGVMVEHQHILNLAYAISPLEFTNFTHAVSPRLGVTPNSRFMLFHSYSFDASIVDIVVTITNGACLCIPSEEVRHEDITLLEYIKTEKITHVHVTPSVLKYTQNLADLKGIQAMCFGGEVLTLPLLKNTANHTQVINVFGPTEGTVWTSTWSSRGDFSSHSIPIGRPLSNVRLYVLNAHRQPVPLGAEGELYIGGAGVARGYFKRPDLTTERFLPDPFSGNLGARMYRTGDLVRYLPDGNLIHMGRCDEQIKIRGFRVEPGEIETRLMEHPLVREAVVLPWKSESNADTRLVAYVVSDPNTSLAQNLRTHLAFLLPDYMVPAAYVCLESLPVTPNGKLDRRALPHPESENFVRQLYEAPQGEFEQKIAAIWSELLGIDRISRHDNFFELGGHSLLVMQFTNLAKRLYNIQADTRGLFSFPILKDFAEKISHSSDKMYCHAALPIRRYGKQMPIFLLPDGTGDTSYAFELTHDIDKNIPVYALPWPSPDGKQPSSIEEMASTMIPLIKNIQSNGHYAIAGFCAGGILAYEITKQLINSGDSVSFLGLFDTPFPDGSSKVSKTDSFLRSIGRKSPHFKNLNNTTWWSRVSKLSLSEAVEEVKRKNIDLKNSDIEWEALLAKQQTHYLSMCAVYEVTPLSITVNLFKATEFEKEKSKNLLKLGWENYHLPRLDVIPVKGTHSSMMTDPNNRALLGGKLTEILISK